MENKFITSHYKGIDSALCGFPKGELTIVAGCSATGKTSFMLNSALKQAEQNICTALFSLELPRNRVMRRILSLKTGIERCRLQSSDLSQDEQNEADSFCKQITALPLFIDDTPSIHISDLQEKIKTLATEHHIEMVWIDYIQLMNGDGETRDEETESILKGLKEIAEEYNVAIAVIYTMPIMTRHELPHLLTFSNAEAIIKYASTILYVKRPVWEYNKSFKNKIDFYIGNTNDEILGQTRLTIDPLTCKIME